MLKKKEEDRIIIFYVSLVPIVNTARLFSKEKHPPTNLVIIKCKIKRNPKTRRVPSSPHKFVH